MSIRLHGLILFFSFFFFSSFGQGYTNWIVGDTSDYETADHLSGIVLAGGGGDNDDAMQWMLERAGGGDVVVIRASNSDGYNDYFYEDLGVSVHSVETIRFDDISASSDPYVLRRIGEAEVLFIAGGDQYDYYELWRNTAIEDTINYLINEKGITVGGTSAGMAILGKVYYTPPGGSLDTDEALVNPFHPDTELIGKDDFLNVPILENVITDTHYDQRDRAGRHMTFLARVLHDFGEERAFGIACNEYTVVAIDEEGIGAVFGEWPEYDDYAYFLRSNCQDDFVAEVLEENSPLTWDRGNAAVKVYKVPGTVAGSNFINLNDDWQEGMGGEWQNWHVTDGQLTQTSDTDGDCSAVLVTSTTTAQIKTALEVAPNPFSETITIRKANFTADIQSVQLYNSLGQILLEKEFPGEQLILHLENLSGGSYILKAGNTQMKIQKIP